MFTKRLAVCAVALAIGIAAWTCQKSGSIATITSKDNMPIAFVDADGSHESLTRDTLRNRYPHLKMEGGEVSLNDRCPVRKVPLNRRLPALFVNGRPIGFC